MKALEAVGATVERLNRPLDLLVGFRGVNYLIEVKTATGKLKKGQQVFLDEWRGQVAVVRTVDHALQVIGDKK